MTGFSVKIKFMTNIDVIEQEAINTAINYQWPEAIKLNKKILGFNKKNLSALLRLAFAYMRLGDLNHARKFYRQVLKIQPINSVAVENLEKIKILQTKKIKNQKKTKIAFNPELFLESAGKTKSVKLVNLGQKNVLAQLLVGQEVILKTKKRKVEVRTKDDDEYIGSLPDDLSKRLRLFIKANSQYSAFIKANSLNNLTVFIREDNKGKKVVSYISFPLDLSKNINEIQKEESPPDEETSEDSSELDIEKIAESLTVEEKEALPYEPDSESEEEE